MGCWTFSGGPAWGGITDAEATAAVHAALDAGITFFDVAPAYGRGHAEEVLGEALRTAGSARRSAIVATKCGVRFDEGHGRIDDSPEWIRREVDESLARLGVEVIDLYQVHWPDKHVPIADTLGGLLRLQEAGKVRAIGLSNHNFVDTEYAAREAGIASFQGLYNLLERNPTFYHTMSLDYRSEAEILPLCAREGLAFLPYSPLMQGMLAGTWGPEPTFPEGDVRGNNPKLREPRYTDFHRLVVRLKDVAAAAGHTLAGLAVAWLTTRAGMGPVIAASTKPAHIAANVAAVERGLSDETIAAIEEILAPHRELLDR